MKFHGLKATAVSAFVIAQAIATGAVAEKLMVASTFAKNAPYIGVSAEKLAENVALATGGAVELEVHGAGELVPPLEVLNSVSSGAIPAGYDFVGYWGGTIPVAALAGSMPFGPTPDLFAGWMWEGGGLEIVQKAYDPLNVKFLPCHVSPPEPGGWFNTELKSVEDLKGLKMRISGLGGKVLNEVGASAQLIPGGEIYVALERGRIDATEYSVPEVDSALGFPDVAKYYYFPGWHQPSSFQSLLINMDVWNGFDKIVQQQVLLGCRATVFWSIAAAPQPQGRQIEKFRAEGVETKRFPDEVLSELKAASDKVIKELVAEDPLVAEAYESLQAYLAEAKIWTDLQTFPE
ncbi:TRAP transporter substrate-binding protein [Stappia indica]|uniref:TRAP transporter substrate-binding protein n=1 Tax=Stappia indica TaxID=538381 RepID=UPI001CD75598|nr:TRAP transporter substrate-binding protein [Stappia indica]MCA1300190.1 TRAP transporter substrate-binding protein [Stappia indica]